MTNTSRTNAEAASKAPIIIPGLMLIEAERRRQIESEGWSSEHDDDHNAGEMALAAACYATPILLYEKVERANVVSYADPWPWEDRWDKRAQNGNVILPNGNEATTERVRQLVKAGALIAAEVDRLLRIDADATPTPPAPSEPLTALQELRRRKDLPDELEPPPSEPPCRECKGTGKIEYESSMNVRSKPCPSCNLPPSEPAAAEGRELPDEPGGWFDNEDALWILHRRSEGQNDLFANYVGNLGYLSKHEKHVSELPKGGWSRAIPASSQAALREQLAEAEKRFTNTIRLANKGASAAGAIYEKEHAALIAAQAQLEKERIETGVQCAMKVDALKALAERDERIVELEAAGQKLLMVSLPPRDVSGTSMFNEAAAVIRATAANPASAG